MENLSPGSTQPSQPAAPQKKKGSFAADALKLVSGTTAAQVITLLTAPVLSRLFSPQAFGLLAFFVSTLGILSVIVCLRYEFAIMLAEDEEEAGNLFAASLAAALLVSGLTAIFFWLAGGPFLRFFDVEALAPYLWMVPAGLLIHGLYQASHYWLSRGKRFGPISLGKVAASTTTSAVPITYGLLGYTSAGVLLWTWIAGTAVNTAILLGLVIKRSGKAIRQAARLKLMRQAVERYKKFPIFDTWGAFINNLSWQLPALMLTYYFSQAVTGHYSMASRVILLPLTLIGSAVGQVFFQRIAQLRGQPELLARMVELVFRILVISSLLPAVLIAILGQEAFVVLLGQEWDVAGSYAQILAPWMFFLFISSPMSNLFLVLERQELALVVNSAILITRVLSLWLGGWYGSVTLALGLWTATGILVYGGMSLWNMRLAGVSYLAMGKVVLEYALYAAPVAALLLWGKLVLGLPAWTLLLLAAGAAAAFYLFVGYKERQLLQYLRVNLPRSPQKGNGAGAVLNRDINR